MVIRILLLCLIGYLLGNLNGAVLISRLVAHDDVRSHGSGNAGLTNFARNYGGFPTLLVLLIDAGKAISACLIGGLLLRSYGCYLEGASLAGLAVGLGHDFPAFLGFRGGKGIVCGAATFLVLDWRCVPPAFLFFVLIYITTGYVSLGSILATLTCGVLFTFLHIDQVWAVIPMLLACAFAVFMHRENIIRLLQGTERKTSFFHKGEKK